MLDYYFGSKSWTDGINFSCLPAVFVMLYGLGGM